MRNVKCRKKYSNFLSVSRFDIKLVVLLEQRPEDDWRVEPQDSCSRGNKLLNCNIYCCTHRYYRHGKLPSSKQGISIHSFGVVK